MSKVLVVATSRQTRGGITSVVKAHEAGTHWKRFNCCWVEAQTNIASKIGKLKCLFKAYAKCLYKVPQSDLVHFHSVPGNCNVVQLPMLLWAKLWRKPIITHLHVGNQLMRYKDNKLFLFVLRNSTHIVTLANRWKDVIERNYDINTPVSVIYNPAPKSEKCNAERGKYFLFAAYLDKNKGCDIALEAFSKIAPDFPEWKLIIAGSGPEENNIKEYVNTQGMSDQIELPGWIAGEKKEQLFKEASAFCLASYEEGFPMSVLDAWSVGTPVISTPVGGLPDVALDGENVLLFNFGDSEDLADKMRMFISKNMFDKLSDASIGMADTTFSIKTISDELSSLYESLINGK